MTARPAHFAFICCWIEIKIYKNHNIMHVYIKTAPAGLNFNNSWTSWHSYTQITPSHTGPNPMCAIISLQICTNTRSSVCSASTTNTHLTAFESNISCWCLGIWIKHTQLNIFDGTGNTAAGQSTCNGDSPFITCNGIWFIRNVAVRTASGKNIVGTTNCNKSPLATSSKCLFLRSATPFYWSI